ncbi:MAG: DNA mismatch repair endonuclease MutL [Myxacorys californica WJT36-NPBG1]|jgi:DNA mismatch repair protein MutL|nr:DNA mismatch repair endonuclease MutL [Myxacorys californica WJT36-NPBG1]
MGFTIQPLPIDVVHLMAAGEVIDSLSAVVRELVENALDAGATRISVSIWADQWRVRVSDNGAGMTLENLQQAALPHTTSKIRDRADLQTIQSLGFRGEALYSLAQLSNLEILSRVGAEQGWRVVYDTGGNPITTETVAIAPGTIITVDRLFETWAARRDGLPSAAQQLKAVQTMIYHLALCHPHVTWQVQQGDREWISLWASRTPKQSLPQMVRGVRGEELQEIQLTLSQSLASEASTSEASLYLLLGLPDRCHRRRPDWVKVAVNGRLIHMPELEQTLLAGFRRTLPRDRYPVCFLHLHLPPAYIDWNRHPAKAEIYLHNLDYWQEQVTSAIEQAFRLNPKSLPDDLYSSRVGTLLKAAESEGGYTVHREIAPATPTLSSLRAIAQVHNRYILAEHASGMWLVEQHIAHERVLYEQICDRWQIVSLEPAIVLNQLTHAQVEQLQHLGLTVEPFGDQLWAVRSIPTLLAEREDRAEALLELSLGGDLQTAQVAIACRSAIRNGTPLTLADMQTLLNQWQQTRNPRTCPHGRPIYLALEESALARFFRRHWVIGKSHGLE